MKIRRWIHQRNLTYPRGLALHGEYLLVFDDDLKIFSVANPAEPTLVHCVNKQYKDLIIYQGKLFAFGKNEITQFGWTQQILQIYMKSAQCIIKKDLL